MELPGKMITLALLVAMISPTALAYGPRPAQQVGGCHEHGQKAPAPSPVSHECCRAGHQIAAVREAVNLRTPFVPVSRLVEFSAVPLAKAGCRTSARPLDPGSPGDTALRV